MTEQEKQNLYNAIDNNIIIVKTENHNMLTGGFRTDTSFKFGDYTIIHSQYSIPSKVTPLGQFTVYGKNNRPMENWNESFKEQKKYIYDMYIAAKNKSEGKVYVNPYKKDKMEVFSNILKTNSKNIFPSDMPVDRCIEAMNELKQVFHKHIMQYRGK